MATPQITNEIAAGEGLYLSAAAKLFPPYRLGRPVSLACVLRWIVDGVRGPNAECIHLEAARLAGKWVTTPAAISRFLLAQTPEGSDCPMSQHRTTRQRQRAAERAEKALEAMGI
jgi:hypothetical protein